MMKAEAMQTTLTFEASATATSSFIETQFPIARLSAESEAARMLAGD
jgi:hypothetical protein